MMQAKDFNDAVLWALHNLAGGKAHKPVAHHAVIAETLRLLKMEPNALGEKSGKLQTHTLIGQSFRNMRVLAEPLTESKKRGEWALTKQGIESCAVPSGQAEKAETKQDDAPTWNVYDDPYLRSLAAQTSSCFGMLYSPQDPVCSTCPLKLECGPVTLDAQRKASGHEAGITEETLGEESDRVLKHDVQTRVQLAASRFNRATWLNGSKITATEAQPCSLCGDDVMADEEVMYVPNQGCFHIDCFDQASQGQQDQAG